MSEARSTCPLCGRLPGSPHHGFCPRSRERQRRLSEALAAKCRPRVLCPGKGLFSALVRGPLGRPATKGGLNPGVPLALPPKPRTAGGLPRGKMRVPTGKILPDGTAEVAVVDRRAAAEVFLADWGHYGIPRKVQLEPREAGAGA